MKEGEKQFVYRVIKYKINKEEGTVMRAGMVDHMELYTVTTRTGTNSAKYDEAYEKYGIDILPCAVADMDIKAPEPIIEAFQRVIDHGVMGYTNLPSNYEELVKTWMKERYDCSIESEWVVFSPRTNIACNVIVEVLTDPKDSILVHSPAYPALSQAVTSYGRNLVSSPLILRNGVWEINFEEMEELAKEKNLKMLIFCNPHNPTGRVWTKEELKKVIRFCMKHDLYLISDDIHGDIVRATVEYTPIFHLESEWLEKMIICNSPVKSYNIPGVILSNIIIPNRKIRQKIKDQLYKLGHHNPNIFAAAALKPAYTQCMPWLKAMNHFIDENIEYAMDYIQKHLPLFHVAYPQGTYLLWINYKDTGLTERQIEEFFLRKAKVLVYLGTHFGKEWGGYVRINIATSFEQLQEILTRIQRIYQDTFK